MPISRAHRPHTNETCLYGWGFNGTHEHEIFQVDATDGNPDEFKKTPEQVNNDMLNNVMDQEGQIGSTPQPLPNIQ